MRANGFAMIAAAVLAACGAGADAGGDPQVVVALPPAGVARFVIVPPEGGPSWLPALPVHLVWEGPGPTFSFVPAENITEIHPIGPGEATAAGGRVFARVDPYYSRLLEVPPPEIPLLAFDRIEVVPMDVDRDGVAERLEGVFTVNASIWTGDDLPGVPTFTTRATANIVAASLGASRFIPRELPFHGDAITPVDLVWVRFDLPSTVESVRLITPAGEIPVSRTSTRGRITTFTPDGVLPWAQTVRLVGEARVLGAGAALEPFAVDVPVLAGPASGAWAESFETDSLDGFVVTHGTVTLADASDGLRALDGERFLLADHTDFGLLFEIEVPDTEAPSLHLDARFAYQAPGLSPSIDVTVAGAGGRASANANFNPLEPSPEDEVYREVSATQSLDVPLAALRGSRAVVSVRGFEGRCSPYCPPATGKTQLDGLRIVP